MSPRAQRQHELDSSLTVSGPVVAPDAGVSVLPLATHARYRELDAHRGIAVVALVIFNVYQFCNVDHFLYFGTLGYTVLNSLDAMVPWLFVIVAFLLFEPVARAAIDGGPPVSVRGFLAHRAVRVLPVYYFAILVVWFTRQPTLPGDWRDLLEHLTFTQVFDEKRIFYTDGPAWSISVMVFFYLAMLALSVALTRVCRRLPSRRQRMSVVSLAVVGLALISLAWKGWSFADLHRSTTGSPTTWFGPLANLDNFAVGMALAVVATGVKERRLGSSGRAALRLAALTTLAVAFATRQADTWTGVYFSTLCAIGFGFLVAAAVLGTRDDRLGRALASRPLLWLGISSYSIYLWHEPIMLALREVGLLVHQRPGAFVIDAVVVLAASVLVGGLSYVLVERPTGRLKRIFAADGNLLLLDRDAAIAIERKSARSYENGTPRPKAAL